MIQGRVRPTEGRSRATWGRTGAGPSLSPVLRPEPGFANIGEWDDLPGVTQAEG